MKSKLESECLLDDVLRSVAPEDFRAAVLSASLRQAGWRRCRRGAAKGLSLGAILLGLAWWSWPGRVQEIAVPNAAPTPRPYGLVRSEQLDTAMLVATQPGSCSVIESKASMIATVETRRGSRLYREINDDELLLLLAGRPAALSRHGPDQATVLILDPPTENSAKIQ